MYLYHINMSENEELKNEAYQGSKIIYEDDEIMFLKCLSYESAKYFNLGFLWQYKVDFFILVDKEGDGKGKPTFSYGIIIDKNEINITDEEHSNVMLDNFLNWYPQIENIFYKTFPTQNIYHLLKKIQLGEEFDIYQINRMDELITGFKFNKNSPGKSMVTLKFDSDEDYFHLFDITDGDVWFLNNLYSYYGNYDMGFYHSDFAYEDWKQGYLLYEFDEKNKQKLIEVVSFFDVSLNDINDDTTEKIAKLLMENFPRETEWIIDDFQTEKETCMSNTAKEEISGELCDPFINYGIFEKNCFHKYVTTVSVLISLYNIKKDKTIDLMNLMKILGHELSVGPYEEYMYEYGCKDFDMVSFNNTVENQLEKIWEKIESSDYFYNIEKYKEIIDKVLSKYVVKKWYTTPKDKDRNFWIEKIDPKTNKIYIRTQKKSGSLEQRSFTLDEFNNFLYNLEIFERKLVKSKKRL